MSADGLEMSPSYAAYKARLVDGQDSTGQASKRSRTTLIAAIGAVVVIVALSSALAYNMGKTSSSSSNSNLHIDLPEPLAAPSKGQVPVYGRTFSYEVSALEAGLASRYSALVRDDATGIEHLVFGKTGHDALEFGIEAVYNTMMEQGLVEEPSESQFLMVIPPTGEGRQEDNDVEMPNKGKSGQVEVMGRLVAWKASPYFNKKLKWKAVATDVATGIKDDAGGRTNPEHAVQAAIENLFRILVEKGIVVIPTGPVENTFLPEGITTTEETDLTTGKSGNVRICGRPLAWTATVYYKFPLKIRFKCAVQDTESGVSSFKKGFKKGEDACRAAIADVLAKDIEQGVTLDLNDNCTPQGKLVGDGFVFEGGALISAKIPMDDEETEMPRGFSKSGDIEVLGRQIHFKAKGYVRRLKWRYKATSTDKATGLSASSSGHKSGKGAVENSVKKLIQLLIEKGHMPVPPTTALTFNEFSGVFLGDVEEDVIDENDIDFATDEDAVDLKDVLESVGNFIADIGATEEEGEEEDLSDSNKSKSGVEVIYGRRIHWKAWGRLRKGKWRYKADARDEATGVSRGSGNHKSGEGAVKEAITNVFRALDEAGIFPPRA